MIDKVALDRVRLITSAFVVGYSARHMLVSVIAFIAVIAAWVMFSSVAIVSAESRSTLISPLSALDYSPYALGFSPDGKMLAVSNHTGKLLLLTDVESNRNVTSIVLNGKPTDLVWSLDGKNVYVSEWGAGTVAVCDIAEDRVTGRIEVDRHPMGLGLIPQRDLLLVAAATTNRVQIVDLGTLNVISEIPVPREPHHLAVTPDNALAVVGNLLPSGRATNPGFAASVSLIDLHQFKRVADIRLPAGTSAVREVAINPDGRWAYVAHCIGKTHIPTTQLERGWVNTNAISIINLRERSLYATVLLDHVSAGAADPWGVAVSGDGKRLWVTLSGVHQLAQLDLEKLHSWLDGGLPTDHWLARSHRAGPGDRSIWLRIAEDPASRNELVNDLGALYEAELITRIDMPGNGPRALSVQAGGRQLAVAHYFSGSVALYDIGDVTSCEPKLMSIIEPEVTSEMNLARRGEMIFHDATVGFQGWLSCATCHPNDGRVDGMNWDLLNDGVGNPKNNRSLLWSHRTPPMMSLGVRGTMEEAALKGFHFLMREPDSAQLEPVRAYLRELTPLASPHLERDGSLSHTAARGQRIFMSERAGCADCHPPPLYTSLEQIDVGTRGTLDRAAAFDTPTLIELYRTAPYLHDGSAASLHEVITNRNPRDQHGHTSHLTPQEVTDLIAFLLSL